MMDNDAGMVRAAPAPMTARQAIKRWTEPENAAPIEPAAKTASPIRKNRRRPSLSARLPPTNNNPANAIAVPVDDPLKLTRGCSQIPHQRRKGHVENGVVDVDDQRCDAHHDQSGPSTPTLLTIRDYRCRNRQGH